MSMDNALYVLRSERIGAGANFIDGGIVFHTEERDAWRLIWFFAAFGDAVSAHSRHINSGYGVSGNSYVKFQVAVCEFPMRPLRLCGE